MREVTCESCIWAEDCPIKKKMMSFGICSDYYRDDELILRRELAEDRRRYEDEWQEYIKDAE